MPRAPAIPSAERRAHAVRALLDLARDAAPDQISTAAIAGRMGVSHGALFRHFPSREALWAETVLWATQELERRFEGAHQAGMLQRAAAGATPGEGEGAAAAALEQVASLMDIHAELLQQHPGLVRMLFAELQRPASSPARETGKAFMQRFRGRLSTLLAQAQRQGGLAPRLDPQDLAGLLVASQQGLMLQALAHDGFAELGLRSRRCVALLLSSWSPPGVFMGPLEGPGAGADGPAAAPGA